jgi:RNA 2',3'-cyclic 3'-phosphodiesterase
VRLFIAIEIPAEIRDALTAFIQELRGIAPHVKWVRGENLHVTLKFLGHTEPAQLPEIERSLGTIRNAQPVTLDFSGVGFFPDERRPRVFWAGMNASANLGELAKEVDRQVHLLGFPLENRPFTPHLTLARFEPPGLPAKLAASIKQNASRRFGGLTASDFHLIESRLKPTGAEYTTLKSFPFLLET